MTNIYHDIATRTGGDIYIGVVGPVRTGKSTFVSRFMEQLVLPNIQSEYLKTRATDELPQSAAGKTIMTTEPKFIPEEAVKISVDDNATFNVRLIDCVGYIVPSALGYIENEAPRMVMTPWFDEEVPFNMAAEIGTQKVIREHSTIGLLVTTDGTVTNLPREEYVEAEERVVRELKEIHKPFVVLLNCADPKAESAVLLQKELLEKYGVPVMADNCLQLQKEDIREILAQVLYEFPIKEIQVDMPKWIVGLEKDHWLKKAVFDSIVATAAPLNRVREVSGCMEDLKRCEYIHTAQIKEIDLGKGNARVEITVANSLFYKVLGEVTGLEIDGESGLMPCMIELAQIKKKYEKIA